MLRNSYQWVQKLPKYVLYYEPMSDPAMESLKQSVVNLFNEKASRADVQSLLELPEQKLNEYLNETDWELCQPGSFPEEWSMQWYQEIREQLSTSRQIPWKNWLSIAALFVVVLSLYFKNDYLKNPEKPRQALKSIRVAPSTLQCIENNERIRKAFILADGSKVLLSPNSLVRFKVPMDTDKRDFWLDGEAVFYVRKNAGRPFTVYSEGIATTALGTVFRISSFKRRKTRVHLIQGRIRVTNQKNHLDIYLNAGEECYFDHTSLVLRKKYGPEEKTVDKTQALPVSKRHSGDEIIFNKTPLPRVFQQIGAVYGIPIMYKEDPTDTRTFTGSFGKTNTPDEILRMIALLNDLEMQKSGDTVYLKK